MNRPVHFEFPAANPERAAAFYSAVFGWKFNKWGENEPAYWLISTGEGRGIDGGMMGQQFPGHTGTTNTMEVENVDAMAAAVEKNGGKIILSKMAVPGIGWLVYCNDTEGNAFGMMQMDANAK